MVETKGQVGGFLSPWLERQRIAHAKRWIPEGSVILDIGCGRAALLKELPSVGAYVGIDVLEDVIGQNRNRYPQHQFFCVDIEREEIPLHRTFSVIVMLAVIEHLVSPARTIARLSSHLQSEGKLILTTPHPKAEQVHRIGASVGIFSREAAEEHKGFFDKDALLRLANEVQLRLVRYEVFQFGLNQVAVFQKHS